MSCLKAKDPKLKQNAKSVCSSRSSRSVNNSVQLPDNLDDVWDKIGCLKDVSKPGKKVWVLKSN